MIGYLTGKPILTGKTLILLVGGVGYELKVNPQFLATIDSTSELSLHVFTHVREDALELFGFPSLADKELFQLLLGVSGVGPSTALAISQQGAPAISQAVQNADVKFFTQIPRIGKKLAQKIIIDLKGKLGSLKELELGSDDPVANEVVEALVTLGFDEQDAYQAIKPLDLANMSTSDAIKTAIKNISK